MFLCHKVLWKAKAPLKCSFFILLALQQNRWMSDKLECRQLPKHMICALFMGGRDSKH